MPDGPTVFLSHSTKGDPDAAAMRRELESELSARGWKVLVDEDGLRGGEDWRGVLYRWIADCDAAIVLMSDKALESKWVRREINLLLWRHALGSPLTIVPVMFAPTKDKSSPELRDLKELQYVSNNGTVQELASAVAARLPDLSVPLPDTGDQMRNWLAKVRSCLCDVTEKELLCAAAEALDACQDEQDFASIRDGQRFLAHQLLGQVRSGRIHTAMEHIAVPISGKLKQLSTLITPVWVNGEVARALLPRREKQTCATLNSTSSETARHYVRRAACCSSSYPTQVVTAREGENLEADLLRDCVVAVRQLLFIPEGVAIEADDVPLGGLPVRWYVERCGGAEITSRVITIGTPSQGSVHRLRQLVNGTTPPTKGAFWRSLPSMYQALPVHRCIESAGELLRVTDVDLPHLRPHLVADGVAFLDDLLEAQRSRPSRHRSTEIGATDQSHETTARIVNGRVRLPQIVDIENVQDQLHSDEVLGALSRLLAAQDLNAPA